MFLEKVLSIYFTIPNPRRNTQITKTRAPWHTQKTDPPKGRENRTILDEHFEGRIEGIVDHVV